ncbi:TetR/AcrR family transcriptional regulator [Streptomyces sp. NPDC051315]|uniref:TetR/AcrR family transcriptional regulator n=1 Tax=Streptomyces sp. NPDC051315 TaxID=3365650 RepID=UPI00379ABAC2
MSGTRRTPAPPREQVLAAAMAMIAERGLEKLTMAALGREVGMSSGHLLYYFGSKDELLLRTLEWSEGRLGAERGRLLTRSAPARVRLDAYVDLYVPDGHRDPHWTLWLEVWNRSQNADEDARDRQAAVEGAWHRDLVALLAEGISRGEFRPVDPDRFAARLRALLDGFSIHVAIGLRGADREQVLVHVREFLDQTLLADPGGATPPTAAADTPPPAS